MNVFTYSRYSTDRQTEASIVDQRRRCHEYAFARDWAIAEDFADEGISGAAFGNRPGVLAALARLERGDVLLVADLSRLSRSQELAPLIDRIRYRGARVIGVLDGFDSDSPTSRMQAGLSGIMSDELRASIRIRTHSALELRAREGKSAGGRAYGIGDELEAAIVREIFARFAAGESAFVIAARLNAEGTPSPRGRRWLASALFEILRNERYVGRLVWNRSQWVKNPDTGRRVRRNRPESEWVVTDGPAIVDAETWQAVRRRLAQRERPDGGRGGRHKYLLSGLLVCKACGHRLIAVGNAGSHYYCGGYKQGGRAACDLDVGARRDVAEEILLAPVRDALLSPEAIAHAEALISQWAREESVRELEAPPELAEIDARIAKLESAIAAGAVDRVDVAPGLEVLHERRTAAQRSAWRKASGRTAEAPAVAVAAYREAAEDFRATLEGADRDAARDVLRRFLGEIPVARAPEGRYLIAEVGLSPVPLLRAAGVFWNGSGGVIPTQNMRLALRRVA